MKHFMPLLFFSLALKAGAQVTCTNPGQTPESAIFVCGSETLTMSSSGLCGNRLIPPPCGDGFLYRDQNPHFFKMACYTGGTLGFLITPQNPLADFNWQLFDITNINPASIFTNPALFVACNWSSDPGETGASSLGTSLRVCSGSQNVFSEMPVLIQGHTYLLMVCNQIPVPDGYEINFSGGTAVITDPTTPRILIASPDCTGSVLLVRMSKKIKCSTVAPDGSDFILNGGASVTGAFTLNCGDTGTDSIFLNLNQPLPNGNYTLRIRNGTDGNTITDVCGTDLAVGESIDLIISTLQPVTVNSITATGCSPKWVDIYFSRPISCNSLAPDGSDFQVSGPQPVVTIIDPETNRGCISGLTSFVRVGFVNRLLTAGTYQCSIRTGMDGNTITDQCGIEMIAGTIGSFTLTDPISAGFTLNIPPSCTATTVSFLHDGNGGASSWNWDFGDNGVASIPNPVHTYNTPGNYKIQLITANNRCSDTATQTIVIPGQLEAAIKSPAIVCPGDTVRFENLTKGFADQWDWDFGNGLRSSSRDPGLISYAPLGREQYYTVKLIAGHSLLGCADTVTRVIRVLSNCVIGIPTAFTPNGDGKNDFLYPLNGVKADQLVFRVYNRYGQLVFEGKEWTRKWDGKVNGILQPTGVYAWFLSYIHHDTREKMFMKGTTLLIR